MKRFLMRTLSLKSRALLKLSNAPVFASKMISQTPVKGFAEDYGKRRTTNTNDRYFNYSGKLKLASTIFTMTNKDLINHYNENKAKFGQQDYFDLIAILFAKKINVRYNFNSDQSNQMHKEIRQYIKTNLDDIITKESGLFAIILYSSVWNLGLGKELNEKIFNAAVKEYEAHSNSYNLTKKVMYIISFNSWKLNVKKPTFNSIENFRENIFQADLKSKYLFIKYLTSCDKSDNNEYLAGIIVNSLASQTDLVSFYQRIENLSSLADLIEVYPYQGKEVEKGLLTQLSKIRELSEEYDSNSIIKTYRALNILKSSSIKLPIYNQMNKEILEIVAFTLKHLTENIKSSFLFDFIDQLGKDLELDESISKEKEELVTQIIYSLISMENNILLKTSYTNKMQILRPIFSLKLQNEKIEKFILSLIDSDFIKGIRISDNFKQVKYATNLTEAISAKYNSALGEYISTYKSNNIKSSIFQITKLLKINFTKQLTSQINELCQNFVEEIKSKKFQPSERVLLFSLTHESSLSQELKDKIVAYVLDLANAENSVSIQDYIFFNSIRTNNPEVPKFLENLKKNEEFMILLPSGLNSLLFFNNNINSLQNFINLRNIMWDISNFVKSNKDKLNDPKYNEFFTGLLRFSKLLLEYNAKNYEIYESEIGILASTFNQHLDIPQLHTHISITFVNDFIKELSKINHKYNFYFLTQKLHAYLEANDHDFLNRYELLKSIIYLQDITEFKEPNINKLNTFIQEKIISYIGAHSVFDQKNLGKQLLILKLLDNVSNTNNFYDNNRQVLDQFLNSILESSTSFLNNNKLSGIVLDTINVLITLDSTYTGNANNIEKIKGFVDNLIANNKLSNFIGRIEIVNNFTQNRISSYVFKSIQTKYLETKTSDLSIFNILSFLKLSSKITISNFFSKELSSKISSDISENLEEIKTNKLSLKFIEFLSKCRFTSNYIYKKLIGENFKSVKFTFTASKKTELFDFSLLNEKIKEEKQMRLFHTAYEKLVYIFYLNDQPNPESNYPLIEKIINSIQVQEFYQVKDLSQFVIGLYATGLIQKIKIKDTLSTKIQDSYTRLCTEKEKYIDLLKKFEELNLGFVYVPDNSLIYSLVNEKEKLKIVSINSLKHLKSYNTHSIRLLEEQDPDKYKYVFLNIQFFKRLASKEADFKEIVIKSFIKKEDDRKKEEEQATN